MKKIFAILLTILLLSVTAVSVSAASATMRVEASVIMACPGDTITFTVTVSQVNNCRSGGYKPIYDSSVFSLVSGECHVSGSGVAMSGFTNGAGAFAYTQATGISGKLFTFTLKVKDSAAKGNYTVSGGANMRDGDGAAISTTANAVQIRVGHEYGGWTKLDDTQHQRTCSICKETEKADHSWEDGSISKHPSCYQTGEKEVYCSTCAARKTEPVPATGNHAFTAWKDNGNGTHSRTCVTTGCTEKETENHTWNSGTVTKQPDCQQTGEKKSVCTGCDAEKVDVIPKSADHSYGPWTKTDDAKHARSCTVSGCTQKETKDHTWDAGTVTKKATCKDSGEKKFTCTGCGATKLEAVDKLTTHAYDHGCDPDCNVCGATRTTSHKFSAKWSKDKQNHWHECSECKEKKDSAAHTPGPEATEKTAQTCTVCAYILKPALNHTHAWATEWTTDETGHWYACPGCEEQGSFAEHTLENDCDPDCSVCGYTRQTEHTYEEAWKMDETGHWYACTGCGEKKDEATHTPGPEATADAAQVCTLCGYELVPALGGDTIPSEAPPKPNTDLLKPQQTPWGLIVIGVVVALVAVAALIFGTKKKKLDDWG